MDSAANSSLDPLLPEPSIPNVVAVGQAPVPGDVDLQFRFDGLERPPGVVGHKSLKDLSLQIDLAASDGLTAVDRAIRRELREQDLLRMLTRQDIPYNDDVVEQQLSLIRPLTPRPLVEVLHHQQYDEMRRHLPTYGVWPSLPDSQRSANDAAQSADRVVDQPVSGAARGLGTPRLEIVKGRRGHPTLRFQFQVPTNLKLKGEIRGRTAAPLAKLVFENPDRDLSWKDAVRHGLDTGRWNATSPDSLRRQAARIRDLLPDALRGYWNQDAYGVRWTLSSRNGTS
jgi:hypothetical protein